MGSLRPDSLLQERWRVLKMLGEGGTSEVYLIEDLRSPHTQYALKLLKPEARQQMTERFRAEASKRLEHPGIVHVYDAFEERKLLCMRLEYIADGSLADRLRKVGALPIPEALRIMDQILSALNYAHLCGIIHRDIKPSNVLMDRSGAARLCDFGIARQLGPNRLTRVGVALGTPQYMSPEQIMTPLEADHRADLYSAGVMLYEMLTGHVPFGDDRTKSEYAVMECQVADEPPDPRTFNSQLDEPLTQILRKSLQKRPGLRFQGGLEFKQALDEYLAGGGFQQPARSDTHVPSRSGSAGYLVYEHPTLGLRTQLARGFCWPALLQGPIWLARHRLFGRASLLFIASMLLLIAAQGSYWVVMAGGAWIAWGPIPGYFANQWRMRMLERQGYLPKIDGSARPVQ